MYTHESKNFDKYRDMPMRTVSPFEDPRINAKSIAFNEVPIFKNRSDYVSNPLPLTRWEREQETVHEKVERHHERQVILDNVPGQQQTLLTQLYDETWHAIMPKGELHDVGEEEPFYIIEGGDWDDVADYEPEPAVVTAIPKPLLRPEGESISCFHARMACDSGEHYPEFFVENLDVEINLKTPQWKQRVVAVDPIGIDYLEQASGMIMQYNRTIPPSDTICARTCVLPPCDICVLGEIRPLMPGYEPFNLLRAAQRHGPAHLIFSTPEAVNLVLDTVYRPYVAVRFGELNMPKSTLAYWWHGKAKALVAVYWSETNAPSAAMVSSLELVDFSPLGAVRQFSGYFLERLHPHTVARLIRRAYYEGVLFSIDIEGLPTSPRELAIVRAVPGLAPIIMEYERVGTRALFVAKGAYKESVFLDTNKRDFLLDSYGNGLIDIAPYTTWLKESRKHHRAIDGAAQTLSRTLEFAIGIPSVYVGKFDKAQTSLFLNTRLPSSPRKRSTSPEFSHHLVRGDAAPIVRAVRAESTRKKENQFPGYINEDRCHSIHAKVGPSASDITKVARDMRARPYVGYGMYGGQPDT